MHILRNEVADRLSKAGVSDVSVGAERVSVILFTVDADLALWLAAAISVWDEGMCLAVHALRACIHAVCTFACSSTRQRRMRAFVSLACSGCWHIRRAACTDERTRAMGIV